MRGSKVRFVGTATIGTDHLDTNWLDQQGICWASAPGCNADAAAQYTLGMMMLSAGRLGWQLADRQVAVVGHGNVGSRVHQLLAALGVRVICCDPPLAAAGLLDSVTLGEALRADIVTLHVPLERHGAHPTHHMINAETIGRMKPGALLVNAARGEVVHEGALLDALVRGQIHAALDVWPDEPRINPDLLAATTVATPHVAGYSVEGKARGTQMIFDAFLDWSGEAVETAGDRVSGPLHDLDAGTGDPGLPLTVADTVIQATHVAADDARMRAHRPDSAATFDPLRRAHAPRHEFSRLRLASTDNDTDRLLRKLGFNVRA